MKMCDQYCEDYLCKAFREAVKNCENKPESVADFLTMYGEAMKNGTVTSSYTYIMKDICKNVVKGLES